MPLRLTAYPIDAAADDAAARLEAEELIPANVVQLIVELLVFSVPTPDVEDVIDEADCNFSWAYQYFVLPCVFYQTPKLVDYRLREEC